MSISAIAKKLLETGTKLNRLFLTGYLEAMVRTGILSVRDYAYQSPGAVSDAEAMRQNAGVH